MSHFRAVEAVRRGIELVRNLKPKYGLKIVVVSNEVRELNAHRINQFNLAGFIDAFISWCFVQLRKPDADIFTQVLGVAQTPARQIVYIENTPLFVQITESTKLAAFGLDIAG